MALNVLNSKIILKKKTEMSISKEKLRHIANLALNGVEGERDNAKRILEKLSLTPEEILNEDNTKNIKITVTYKNNDEFEILKCLYFKITNAEKLYFSRINSRKIEIEILKINAKKYEQHMKSIINLYRKEHKKFVDAFIQKNDLFSDSVKINTDLTTDILDMLNMAKSIKNIIFSDLLE